MLGSMRAYARHRKEAGLTGGSLAAVQKAVKTRRIKLTQGKIDFEKADKDWNANSNHRQQRSRGVSTTPNEEIGSFEGMPENFDGNFLEAQRRHEWLKVQKAELELEVRKGELLERSKMEEQWLRIASEIKSKLMIIPGALSGRLVSIADAQQIRQILESEIKESLSALSRTTLNAA